MVLYGIRETENYNMLRREKFAKILEISKSCFSFRGSLVTCSLFTSALVAGGPAAALRTLV
jgi:hypothetical protein